MSKLNQEELLEIMGDSIEEGRKNIRDLKGSLDISQDEFDERFYKLNQAEDQIRKMIQKPELMEEEFQVEAKKLFERSKSFKELYDVQVYLSALISKLRFSLQKPGVTEEWIEEKATELFAKHSIGFPTPKMIVIFKDFIHEFARR